MPMPASRRSATVLACRSADFGDAIAFVEVEREFAVGADDVDREPLRLAAVHADPIKRDLIELFLGGVLVRGADDDFLSG